VVNHLSSRHPELKPLLLLNVGRTKSPQVRRHARLAPGWGSGARLCAAGCGFGGPAQRAQTPLTPCPVLCSEPSSGTHPGGPGPDERAAGEQELLHHTRRQQRRLVRRLRGAACLAPAPAALALPSCLVGEAPPSPQPACPAPPCGCARRYWIYAAVTAGAQGLLISNDEMRDHIFQVGGKGCVVGVCARGWGKGMWVGGLGGGGPFAGRPCAQRYSWCAPRLASTPPPGGWPASLEATAAGWVAALTEPSAAPPHTPSPAAGPQVLPQVEAAPPAALPLCPHRPRAALPRALHHLHPAPRQRRLGVPRRRRKLAVRAARGRPRRRRGGGRGCRAACCSCPGLAQQVCPARSVFVTTCLLQTAAQHCETIQRCEETKQSKGRQASSWAGRQGRGSMPRKQSYSCWRGSTRPRGHRLW
jgi:hypothetical protein